MKEVSNIYEKTAKVISEYIDELEEQEVPHVEIVHLLMDIFSKAELETLGFGDFIKD